jgi:outer membrane receptor protein involved in Fe transport
MAQSIRFRRHILASALLALISSAPAAAQETEPSTEGKTKATELDTVSVTGSRIKRSEVEGPAPVTIITGEQIKAEGFTTVYEALTTLTEATGSVQNDYDWGQSSVNASPLNLRDLGPGRSLLLINGRRVADYPMPYQGKSNFANYNNIPTGIVERIEVLSGGASAIYGSDAVAGVVNVILKKDIDDDTFRARWGTSTEGGRIVKDISWSGGKHGDKWSLAYTFQYFDRGELLAKDRPFMDSELDRPYRASGPEDRFFGTVYQHPSNGIRLRRADGSFYYAPPEGACASNEGEFYTQARHRYDRNTGTVTEQGAYCAQSAVFRYWGLKNGSKDLSGYLYGNYDFDNGLQAWATVGVWKSTGESNTFMTAWGSENFYDPRIEGGTVALNLAKFFTPGQIGGADNALTRSNELSWDLSTGLRGTMFHDRFDWEFSLGRGEYTVEEKFPSIHEARAAEYFLGPSLGVGPDGSTTIRMPNYDRLWYPISQHDYERIAVVGRKRAESWITQGSFTVSGNLFEGWAGPIGFAGTLEAAKQGYELHPDRNTLGTSPVYYTPFGNVEQGGGERKRYAAGVEFKIPLLKTLTLSTAARYDRYDAVADDAATTWNAGLEWRPFSNLLLRGSYATSFRAPDMHFVYADPSVSIADQTDYLTCIRNGRLNGVCNRDDWLVDNPEISREGSEELKYEEGDSFTYGFVWDIIEGLSFSADYWRINLENQIDDVDADQVLKDEAYCLTGQTPDGSPRVAPPSERLCQIQIARVTRNAAGEVTGVVVGPINRAEQSVSGVDMSSRYRLATDHWGTFNFSLNYTHQRSYRSRQYSGDPFLETRDIDRKPRYKGRASVAWDSGKRWNATIFTDWISGTRSDRYGGCTPFADGFRPEAVNGCTDTDPNSPTYNQKTELVDYYNQDRIYWNTSVGYKINDNATVNLYVSNIFNKHYQDKWCGGFAYCVADPVGREVAAEFVYKLD